MEVTENKHRVRVGLDRLSETAGTGVVVKGEGNREGEDV